MPRRLALPLLFCAIVAASGCATRRAETGREKVVAPAPVSQVYSEVDLAVKLATAAPPTEDMSEDACLQYEYQRHIRKLTERLVAKARVLYPDLVERGIEFQFLVAPSAQPGVLSNAGGTIIVLQGTQPMLPDATLAFVLAREIGHVIGRHHDEDSATRMMFSALTYVLFPAAALVKGLSTVLPTTVAGTAVTGAAVSYLGATALRMTYRDDHLREAERIAFRLMAESGWDLFAVADEARTVAVTGGDDTWMQELNDSLRVLDQLAYGPRRRPFRVQPGPAPG